MCQYGIFHHLKHTSYTVIDVESTFVYQYDTQFYINNFPMHNIFLAIYVVKMEILHRTPGVANVTTRTSLYYLVLLFTQ